MCRASPTPQQTLFYTMLPYSSPESHPIGKGHGPHPTGRSSVRSILWLIRLAFSGITVKISSYLLRTTITLYRCSPFSSAPMRTSCMLSFCYNFTNRNNSFSPMLLFLITSLLSPTKFVSTCPTAAA